MLTNELHPNEIVLIPSRATLGHTVSPEEYDRVIEGYSRLMVTAMLSPKHKEALTLQYDRQRLLIKSFNHSVVA